MIFRIVAASAAAVLALAPQPRSDVMVELFTSQGCSSCPRADRLVAELAERPGVIVLSFHVDYWDYLGWRDTFADAAYTERQNAYRDSWDERVVYTPQVVLQGRNSTLGDLGSAVRHALEAERDAHGRTIRIAEEEGMLKAHLRPVAGARPCTVWLARFDLSQDVAVERGENAGRTLTYRNVVTSLDRIGEWDGAAAESLALPQPAPGEGVAVWLQDGPGGPILAAEAWRG